MGRTLAPSSQVKRILEDQSPAPGPDQEFDRQVKAVLFSDIVGSTSYFEQRGDDAGMRMVERHNNLLFPQVESCNGTIIKTIGDAIMASFPSCLDAVRSAIAMQEALKDHNKSQPEQERIRVRIGINYGEVIVREKDLFGDVVNAAARVESLATAGVILVSGPVRASLDQSEFNVVPFDAVLVKGKQDPLEVFEISWDPDAATPESGPRPYLAAGDVTGGRFEILSLLGEGGMGQVFRARDRALDEEVALKFIRARLAGDPESLAQFKQEVKLARSVTHRNICRIHEFLQMEGRTFISMEMVAGQSLAEWMHEKIPVSQSGAIRIVGGICAGLEAAHERGITHRDLKPGNVMIEEGTGRVVITDFGIARLATRERSENEDTVAGTPEYMSPEQAQGKEAGPASDLYSVGVILYELLTGKLPFTGPTPLEVAQKQVDETPVPPRSANSNIPPDLESVVLRCLEKDPKKRYADARLLAVALGVEKADGKKSPYSLPLLVGGIVVLVLALAGFFLLVPGGKKGPGGTHVLRHLVSSQAVEQAARWSPDGRQFAFLRGSDVWVSPYPEVNPRQASVDAKALTTFNLAGITWSPGGHRLYFPLIADGKNRLAWTSVSGDESGESLAGAGAADLSPNGEKLAFTEDNQEGGTNIAVARLDGSGKKTLLAGTDSLSYLHPRWSPDGKKITFVLHQAGFSSTRDIGVADAESGEQLRLTGDGVRDKAYNTDPVWSPDGEWIVYASKRRGTMTLWAVPSEGGDSVPITQGATKDQRDPDVSPDGSTILFNTADRRLDISSVVLDSKQTRPVTEDVWVDRFPAWSPAGNRIAFRSQRSSDDPKKYVMVLYEPSDKAEEIFDAPEGMRDFEWCGSDQIVYTATVKSDRRLGTIGLETVRNRELVKGFHRLWTPTGDPECKNIVFTGQKKSADPRRLFQVALEGGPARQLGQEPGFEMYPAFSPKGEKIAFRWAPSAERLGEAELRVIPAAGGPARTISKHPSFQRSQRRIRWSPDERWLYYMESFPGGGRLWRVPAKGGKPELMVELNDIHTFDYDLDPDCKILVYPRATYSGDLFALENVEW